MLHESVFNCYSHLYINMKFYDRFSFIFDFISKIYL